MSTGISSVASVAQGNAAAAQQVAAATEETSASTQQVASATDVAEAARVLDELARASGSDRSGRFWIRTGRHGRVGGLVDARREGLLERDGQAIGPAALLHLAYRRLYE